MTDTASASTEPAQIRRQPPPSNWDRRMRWFLSEFLVVVTGVIVALALNAWWQDREDAKKELTYLRQLNADLTSSGIELGEARAFVTEAARASALVCHQFWRRDEPDDARVYEKMLFPMRSGRVLPVLGTARALIASGDLRLIESVGLRNAVTHYVDAMDTYIADSIRYDETYYREGIRILNERVVLFPLPSQTAVDRTLSQRPDETTPPPFAFDMIAALKDRVVYTGYTMLLIGHRGQSNRYRDMQDETDKLQKQVEESLAKMPQGGAAPASGVVVPSPTRGTPRAANAPIASVPEAPASAAR